MKRFVFVLKDRAAESFSDPLFFNAPGQATRSFGDEINRAERDNQHYQHPDDFDLYEIGVYDTDSAAFDTHPPRLAARGKDVSTKIVEN